MTRTIAVSVGDQDFTSSPASFRFVIDSDRDGDGVPTWIESPDPAAATPIKTALLTNGDARIATLLDSLDNPYTVVSCESVSIRDAGFQLAPRHHRTVSNSPAGLLTFALEESLQQGACQIELLVSGDVDANSWWIVPERTNQAFVFDGMVGVRQRAGRTFLQLVDGGRGDADGVADGRILFQGLPSKMATSSLWHNSLLRADVNADGVVSPIDALLVINWINSEGAGSLPARSFLSAPFLDPNGDGDASPIDVAIVIQQLNQTASGIRQLATGWSHGMNYPWRLCWLTKVLASRRFGG
ncbi:MAG: dockerin type I domain-containing protein [Pirellulaceae bacterium]